MRSLASSYHAQNFRGPNQGMSIFTALFLCLFFHLFSSHFIHATVSLTLSKSTSIHGGSGHCNLTPHPEFCRSSGGATSIHDSGRLFIHKSLTASKALLKVINRYLRHNSSSHLSKFQTTTFALRDCKFLLTSNVEMLSNIAKSIKNTNKLKTISQYEDLETQLSATLTNKQTCIEGLTTPSSSSIADDLSPSISNGSMLCSISLAFFKNGWEVPYDYRRSGSFVHHQRKLQEAISSANITKTVIVNPNGGGNYTTIGDAISAAPNDTQAGKGYYRIRVAAGVYEEYISIASNKMYLMIVGDGINRTIITGNRSVRDGWTTFNSATFAVVGQGFVGVNLTIRNTAGPAKHQAVALRNGADLSAFYNCSFEGYQDTLYTHSMRQFYRECDIYGTVDYIFGTAAVVLQRCNMYSRLPLPGQFNAITAQGKTDINQNSGISIHRCSIKSAIDLASSNGATMTYLGRPWRTYSTTLFVGCFLDSLISPLGWLPWSGNQSLDTLYYAEYNNTGPGSNTSSRVNWPGYHIITNGSETALSNFTVSNFTSGEFWLPSTGVPYIPGLV